MKWSDSLGILRTCSFLPLLAEQYLCQGLFPFLEYQLLLLVVACLELPENILPNGQVEFVHDRNTCTAVIFTANKLGDFKNLSLLFKKLLLQLVLLVPLYELFLSALTNFFSPRSASLYRCWYLSLSVFLI